jgi:NitT/TauT family transport system ATP-binding protein
MTRTLVLDDVTKQFATGTVALEDVSLSVSAGEFVSVVGPSGCGKSTLLRLASGLDDVSGGSIEVNAHSTSYVFQEATLLEWRSALRNVELVGELRGVGKADRRRAAQEALDLVGLTGFEKQHPRQLSGGMRMRVSIARALASRPEVIFFDEPFGALDEITRLKMQEDLQQIVADGRYVSLFITHSVSEAVYLANRVLVMSARPGRIVGEVRVDAPHPRPSDFRFTSEFSELTEQVSDLLAEGSH